MAGILCRWKLRLKVPASSNAFAVEGTSRLSPKEESPARLRTKALPGIWCERIPGRVAPKKAVSRWSGFESLDAWFYGRVVQLVTRRPAKGVALKGAPGSSPGPSAKATIPSPHDGSGRLARGQVVAQNSLLSDRNHPACLVHGVDWLRLP